MPVVAIFENDPANANVFKKHFPEAAVFLIDTVAPPNSPAVDEDVIVFESYIY